MNQDLKEDLGGKVLEHEDKTEMYRAFMLANFNYFRPTLWYYCDVSMIKKDGESPGKSTAIFIE